MTERPLSRRRMVLAILAVVIPSVALIGLGIGLILQELQLAESRRTEAAENTFELFAASVEVQSFNRSGLLNPEFWNPRKNRSGIKCGNLPYRKCGARNVMVLLELCRRPEFMYDATVDLGGGLGPAI